MDWKKSNVTDRELEKHCEAYIKEALEMAKRAVNMSKESVDKSVWKNFSSEKAGEETEFENTAPKAIEEETENEKIKAETKEESEAFEEESDKLSDEAYDLEHGSSNEKGICDEDASPQKPIEHENIPEIIDIGMSGKQKTEFLQSRRHGERAKSPAVSSLTSYINEHNKKSGHGSLTCQEKKQQR